MSDTRTPDEIERDIERERAQLGNTVDELQDRFSPERILRDVGRGFSEHGGDIGKAVTQSIKRNPVALALTGIGLAWLMSGKSWDETRDGVKDGVRAARDKIPTPSLRSGRAGNEDRAVDRGYGASASLPRDYDRFDERGGRDAGRLTDRFGADHPMEDDWLWAEDDAFWADEDDYESGTGSDGPGVGQRVSDAASSVGDSVRGAAGSVGAGVQSAASSVGSGASAAAGGVASGAAAARDATRSGAASVRDGIAAAGHSTAERAKRIRKRLAKGTETLTEEARERVIAARWAAVKARRAVASKARQGADAASDFYEQNPLVVGGLALAAGAILAGALPRTKQEDRAFGAYSDDAYDRAERIFQAERRKATQVAERAAESAKEVLKEQREKVDDQAPGEKSAVEHLADEVRDSASRVADATTEEAKKQKLGKPTG